MFSETVTVVENRPLTGGHFLLSVHSPRQAQATRPGQFAMVRLLDRSEVLLRRPMSIYDVKPMGRAGVTSETLGGRRPPLQNADTSPVAPVASAEVLQLLYKIVGRGTRLMADLKLGDRAGLIAPLGHGFFEEEYEPQAREADEVLHVAGGIGIAALLLPARSVARAGFRQRLFFGGRTKEDLVAVEDFRSLVEATVLAT